MVHGSLTHDTQRNRRSTLCFEKFIAVFLLCLFAIVLLPDSANHVNEIQIISIYQPCRLNVELASRSTRISRIYYKNISRARGAGNRNTNGNKTENWK